MIKVLTIVNSLDLGGIEKTLLLYLKSNNTRKIKIEHSICCYKADGVLESEFKELGIPIYYLVKSRSIIKDFLQLYKLCKQHHFDIIHSRFGYTSVGLALAAKILNIPIIVSFHSTQPSYYANKNICIKQIFKIYTKISLFLIRRLSAKIIGHSKANLDANFKGWRINNKFEVIYNGIKLESFLQNNRPKILNGIVNILHIGSPRAVKNHKMLLYAFSKLLDLDQNYHLTLVGVQKKTDIYNLVSSLHLTSHVTIVDCDFDVSKYFCNADIFILPSLYEGFGNVLIEAQYSFTPICCSNLPAFYESAYSIYYKYFFNPTSIDTIVDSIKLLVSDLKSEKLTTFNIESARQFAEQFSIESMCDKLNELYISLYENDRK